MIKRRTTSPYEVVFYYPHLQIPLILRLCNMNSCFKYFIPGMILLCSFSSCAVDNNTAADTQSRVDSIVNMRIKAMEISARLSNDSIIMAMAIARANATMADTTTLQVK